MMIRKSCAIAFSTIALLLAGCGDNNSGSSSNLSSAPEILSWVSVNGVWVPLSANDGPSGGTTAFTGFGHSPQGAGIAAINQSVQLSTALDSEWPSILSVVVMPGEARDTYAAYRALISVTSPVDESVVPTILGYGISEYGDNAATVKVYQRYPDESLGSSTVHMAWNGEDWRIDLPPAGSQNMVESLSSLPDFVELESPGTND